MIIHANKESFEKVISLPSVIVDFWAPWCGPCRMLTPVLEELAENLPHIQIAKVNVDDEPELAMKYNISSIPAILYFEKGQLKSQTLGYMEKEQLLERLNIK